MSRIDIRSSIEPPEKTATAGQHEPASSGNSVAGFIAGVPAEQAGARTLAAATYAVMIDQPRSVAAEKFWRLKTKLLNLYKDTVRVIVVTSPAPRDGKSFVALNLALAFAAEASQTLLVDADLRRPTVHNLLIPQPTIGLGDVLRGAVKVDQAIVRLKNTQLRVLPGGKPVLDPVEMLSSPACNDVFTALSQRFSRIIVDTPPIVPFADADVLAAFADGVVMVVRAGVTPATAYTQAVSLVTSTRVLGVVLNDVTRNLADYGHYHERYHSSYYYDREKEPK